LKKSKKIYGIGIWAIVLCALWWPIAPASACSTGKISAEGYEVATLQHTYSHWKQGRDSPVPFVFVDVRTADEYSHGHIPGAINIPVDVLAQHLETVPHDKQVYVYCEGGVRAARAGSLLVRRGFTNIEVVPASMRGWRDAGYPVNKGDKP